MPRVSKNPGPRAGGRVVLVGGGGHAAVLAEAARLAGLAVAGYTDRAPTGLAGVEYLGTDSVLDGLRGPGRPGLAIAFGSVRAGPERAACFGRLAAGGADFVTLIHPSALVSPSARLGKGVQVMAGAMVQARAELGDDTLVNSGAIVEHDCRVGPHCHVATGAVLAGAVTVGAGSHVGAGARILQGLRIGDRATVGAGAVVTRDVADDATVVGVPARPLARVDAPPRPRPGARIALCEPYVTGDEWSELRACLESGWISSSGPAVDRFAAGFGARLGGVHATALGSGTAAIHLALLALGVGPGDRVVLPSLTFIAAANPIRYLGAEPVFVDSEARTYNMEPGSTVDRIEALVRAGKKPKAVLLVHLYGHPADAGPILEACARHGIPVVEDATEALGSLYQGEPVGTLGRIGCFSFNGNKLITTGGGGMAVSKDPALVRRIAYLASQAKDDARTFLHLEVGYNYRLSNLQAAMGCAQLAHMDELLARKRRIAARYRAGLAGIPGILPNPEEPWSKNCFWNYMVLLDPEVHGRTPLELMDALQAEGIETRPFFRPLHLLPMYAACERTSMQGAELLWARGLALPCSAGLTGAQQDRVLAALAKLLVPRPGLTRPRGRRPPRARSR